MSAEDTAERPFWERLRLDQMDDAQWEALCDGCARCCLVKLEDEDTGELAYTAVACHLLDLDRCRCTRYPRRHELVPDCVELGPEEAAAFDWLPVTCAYRILARGGTLPVWHPLVSGDPDSVHRAGISVRGRAVSEGAVHPDDIETYLVRWVETER